VEPQTSPAGKCPLERILRLLQITTAVLAIAFVTWLLGDVLLLIFAAALLAIGLHALTALLSRAAGIKPGWALTIVVAAILLLLGLGLVWAGPRLAHEAPQLQYQLLHQIAGLHAWLERSSWGSSMLRQLPPSLGGSADSPDFMPRVSGIAAGALWSAIGAVGTLILLTAVALYFAAAPDSYIAGSLRLIPPSRRSRARHILGQVARSLRSWLAGQLLDMLVVGVLIGGGLALLGVPFPFILAFIAALLNFVPYIGALAGAAPAILVAFSQGPQQALSVAALFIVVQTLEGNFLSPMIQRRAVDLPPAVTILAQTTFAALFGLPGIILATPVAAAILAALREVTADAA